LSQLISISVPELPVVKILENSLFSTPNALALLIVGCIAPRVPHCFLFFHAYYSVFGSPSISPDALGSSFIPKSFGKRGGTSDITVVSPTGKTVNFEVKADRPKGDGRKTDERSVDYPTLIAQICIRMLDESAGYEIVISKEGLPWFKDRMPRIPLERLQFRTVENPYSSSQCECAAENVGVH
jgi:hypothetical protein